MQKKPTTPILSTRAEIPDLNPMPGVLCLSPTLNEALKKVKTWMTSISKKETHLASSEVNTPNADMFQPLFQNDYAPPVVSNEILTLPVPDGIKIENTSKPDSIRMSWNRMNSRHLFLVQINVENPDYPSCWITNCVSIQSSVEIESVDLRKPYWTRVCSLSNEGRSKWASYQSNPTK